MARGGAKPGERRGGRAKGTPNKKSLSVTERLETIGCDPIEGMAQIAMDDSQPVQLRASMYRELAPYVAPKRKTVEVTDREGDPIQHGVLIVPGMSSEEDWLREAEAYWQKLPAQQAAEQNEQG